MNLATFVTTWMEPQARAADGRDARQEHDRQGRVPADRRAGAALRRDPRRLWHAPDVAEATGCSTTGSSEAAMLGGLALKRRWQQRRRRRRPAGRPAEHGDRHQRPGLLGEVRQLLGRRAAAACRWRASGSTWRRRVPSRCATRTRSAWSRCSGSTFDGSYEPVADICAALDDLQAAHRPGRPGARGRRVRRVRRAVPRPGPGVGLPRCRGWRRSTPPATSTAWCTRASAGWCGATRRRCRPT